MTKTTKMLLTISLTAFALGFTNVLGGIGTPVGAIFFGLFLNFRILEKEMALFDKEQELRIALAESYKGSATKGCEKVLRTEGTATQLTLSHAS
jgi:hypothetical protein